MPRCCVGEDDGPPHDLVVVGLLLRPNVSVAFIGPCFVEGDAIRRTLCDPWADIFQNRRVALLNKSILFLSFNFHQNPFTASGAISTLVLTSPTPAGFQPQQLATSKNVPSQHVQHVAARASLIGAFSYNHLIMRNARVVGIS